jgi:hypothetical protein
MTKQELIQISKVIKFLIEKEVTSAQKPLLAEIKRLQASISQVNMLLSENANVVKSAPSKNKNSLDFSISDILSEVSEDYEDAPKKKLFKNSKSPIASIFEELTPFNEESEQVESVLDYMNNPQLANSNDPVAKVLNKLQNTDFKKTLRIMENSANRHNSSEMNR